MTPQAEIVQLHQKQSETPVSPAGDDVMLAILTELRAIHALLAEKTERPLYVTPEEAARIADLGKDVIREHLAFRKNPLPHLAIGNRKYVEVAGIAPHFKNHQLGGNR
jgi:hypothetical protein